MEVKEVFKMYNIKMENIVVNGPEKYIKKSFTGDDEIGPYFNVVQDDPDFLTEEIIPIVKHFIGGNIPPMDPNNCDLGGIGTFTLTKLDGVYFHNPYNGDIVQIVPLEHFKIIAEAWRDFLLQSPIDDSEV